MQKKFLTYMILVSVAGILAACTAILTVLPAFLTDISVDGRLIIIVLVSFLVLFSAANCIVVYSIVNKTVIKGIKETILVLKRVSEGKINVTADVRYNKEFEELSDGINFMLESIRRELSESYTLYEELGIAMEQAEQANKAKSAFFSSISHEIRTPMNAIVGMSELLTEDEINGEQLDKIIGIKRYSDVLLGIIDDLLDFSKIEDGSYKLNMNHYDFREMMKRSVERAKYQALEKGLSFTAEIADGLPQFLYGDAMKLKQALSNLLTNAVKYTDKGSVKFTVQVNEGLLHFLVQDTGRGIKGEDISRLFNAFEQLEGRKSRGLSGGMGLGLVITDKVIKLMKGKLTVESVYGFGSTFKIEIPFEEGSSELTEADVSADGAFYVSAPDVKVLMVDDIDVNLTVGVGFLKLHEITPDTATSAKEAIKLVCEKDYDIIFMDHMMPETDGVKATEIIRSFGGKYAKSGNLKIIALTANVSHETKELMLDCGMDDFLSKPLTLRELNRILIKWIPVEKRQFKMKKINREIPPEEYSPAIKAASGIAGMNVELGLRRSGGGIEDFENSLRLLCKRIPKSLVTLEIHITGERIWDFAVEAHGMKGALSISGLEELSNLAGFLETAAKNEDIEICKERLPAFKRKLTDLGIALESVFFKNDNEKQAVKKLQGSVEILHEITKNLTTDIERFDRNTALADLNNALKYTFGEVQDRILEGVKSDLEDFDYDSALERLQNIK